MSANTSQSRAEFRQIEHAGWQRLAAGYDQYFRDLAAQMIDSILDAAAVVPGKRVLDLCCGPGHVAARAKERGASPVGVDYSAQMVGLAQRGHPDISFREGDAEAYERDDRQHVPVAAALTFAALP